ncbi:uncharacterized protein LOC143292823 [Babylonia areolata]|uniref:uncharacterized protein LOC143292823 n=1 Tax=Babylonia areolata TaxID=304850 RepID=UPI003FD17BE4
MATKTRIKVSLESAEPFWMFVNTEESPQIAHIQQKIEQRFSNVTVTSLFLDGCVLPADETTELLRDNDNVHVIANISEDDPSPQRKKQRKRKHSDEGVVCSESETQAGMATQTMSVSDSKRKKKSKNDKLTQAFDGHQSDKEKGSGKKLRKKILTDKKVVTDTNDKGLSTQTARNKASKTQNEMNEEAPGGTEQLSKTALISNSTPILEATDSAAVTKQKRRRRQKRKAQKQPEAGENSAKMLTVSVTKQTPAELRIPKWQQAQNRKIVFSSDGESADESGAGGASMDQANSQEEAAEKSQDALSLASAQRGISDHNSSFSDSYLQTSAVSHNLSEDSHQRAKNKDGTSAGTEFVSTEQVPDINVPQDVNGSTEMGAENEEDEWFRDKQYEEKLSEEVNLKRRCPSALDKALTPVHLYTGGRHEVIHPNLPEYLRMSPEERGATVPPYMTARRLSNGAMLYSRKVGAASKNQKTASSPFKKPDAYPPATASPRSRSKQQQLETVNTNRSFVMQNMPAPSATENEDNLNGSCPAEEGSKQPAASQETVVHTSVSRDYSLFDDLTAAPKAGDQIAYKVLEMGEDYTPGISDYKEAEVLAYDASTQNVTVRLHEVSTKKTLGKFDLPEEAPMEEEVTLELSSMFEPKLISSH